MHRDIFIFPILPIILIMFTIYFQSSACLLIRNLVSRVKEHSTALLDRGIEEQLRMIANRHEKCADSVKSALRDLGCQVSLREEWRGEGHNLER